MLTETDIKVVKKFIETQIRFSFNDSESPPSDKDIAYLLALAKNDQVEIYKPTNNDIEPMLSQAFNNPLKILPNRKHVSAADSEAIKTYCRLGILEYLREEKHIEKQSFNEIKTLIHAKVKDSEIESKQLILAKLQEVYKILNNNLSDLSKRKVIGQISLGIFILSMLPVSYLIYDCINLFSILNGDLSIVTKYLWQTILPSFSYAFVPLITSGSFALYYTAVDKEIQKAKPEIQDKINELYLLGLAKMSYPNMDTLVQELQDKIVNLETEVEILKAKQNSYCKTTALLTNDKSVPSPQELNEDSTQQQYTELTVTSITSTEEEIQNLISDSILQPTF